MATAKMACPCCKHNPPHCACKKNRKPRDPAAIITIKPHRSQLRWFLNLNELAYYLGRSLYPNWPVQGLTALQVSGAIRAIGVGNDKTLVQTASTGKLVRRQQTMLYSTELSLLLDYLAKRLGVTPHNQPPGRVR